jgi:riboflavin synthase
LMFTGIVEQVGTVTAVDEEADGRRLRVSAPGIGALEVGASIAVNGVCLTVVERAEDTVSLDVVPETLHRTNLGELGMSSPVNLERPMAADGRFDGHVVQGHVDGTGVVASIRDDDGTVVRVEAQPELLRHIVEKGSITIDGVSLTVVDVDETGFEVALIPHTLEVTTLGLRNVGDTVNLETDVLAKYVEKLVRHLQ